MSQDEGLERLETVLGHRFARLELLRRALTHSSHAQEAAARNGSASEATGADFNNERLEFLGDAILGFLTSEVLLERFPELREGQLSKIKANLVSARRLYRVAQSLNLGEYLTLGRGEEKTGGRAKPALLADALEAVIAAIYLDGGLEPARQFIARFLLAELDQGRIDQLLIADHKSVLQEYLQATGRPSAEYRVVAEAGPEHQKAFTVEVGIQGETLASATASTKKRAEQEAARAALAVLQGKDQTAS